MSIDTPAIHVADHQVRPPRHRRSDTLKVATPMSDPLRRLRGEPPVDTATREEARGWVDAYTEMVDVWQHTAMQFELRLAGVSSRQAGQQLGDVDHPLLTARCERLRLRLHLWEQRVRELAEGPRGRAH